MARCLIFACCYSNVQFLRNTLAQKKKRIRPWFIIRDSVRFTISTIWWQLPSSYLLVRINIQFCRSAESNAHNGPLVHINCVGLCESHFMWFCTVRSFAKARGDDVVGKEKGDDEFHKEREDDEFSKSCE